MPILRCTKSTKLSSNLYYHIGAYQPMISDLKRTKRKWHICLLQQFLRHANSSFLVLPCYILFLEKRNRLASKRSSVNRQIQLIEHYCTGLEAGASFYKILVSIKLLSPVSAVSYLASQNGWNIAKFCKFSTPSWVKIYYREKNRGH